MASDGYITLTENGKMRAESVLERHTILADLLIHIGVSEETAKQDACKLEHDLSEESFKAIKRVFHSEFSSKKCINYARNPNRKPRIINVCSEMLILGRLSTYHIDNLLSPEPDVSHHLNHLKR